MLSLNSIDPIMKEEKFNFQELKYFLMYLKMKLSLNLFLFIAYYQIPWGLDC
jgi:hypothetical protein